MDLALWALRARGRRAANFGRASHTSVNLLLSLSDVAGAAISCGYQLWRVLLCADRTERVGGLWRWMVRFRVRF